MPSFDVVSELDLQEVDNAVNQTSKEISQRFDFRGTDSKIEFDRNTKCINLISNSEEKIENIVSVLQSKAVKRSIDLKAFHVGKPSPMTGNLHKCAVKLIEGIEKETAKKITKYIKDLKLKVQAAIHDDKVRVTGKKRDFLQEVIGELKNHNFEVPLQFNNFRD
jgi:uncharacterized protein YajQ (UPF0234 family)